MLTAKTSQPIPSPRPVSPFLLLECPRFHFHIIYACIVPLHRSARPNSRLTRESTPTIIYRSALSARPCPLPPTHSIRRCFPNSSTYSPIPSFLLAITILSTLPTPAQQQYSKHSLEHGGTTSLPRSSPQQQHPPLHSHRLQPHSRIRHETHGRRLRHPQHPRHRLRRPRNHALIRIVRDLSHLVWSVCTEASEGGEVCE